ncbi:thrombospondin type 3 repeat-containing protein [Massilia sp. UMI-21]|nr:thrombospondin type 3 repeat-containing protein [Massilia sp. UMI-21]
MNKRFAKTAVMLALTALSTVALAQAPLQTTLESEPPGRVGRVALVQGKVSINGGVGESATAALVNWPITTRNLVTTEPNGRTELRVGSTAIRIDGDSSLEVTELDDDSLRLRLHYGSASIRILSEDVLPEFELSTPQGRVRMLKPGRLRVDAERVRDTSVVSVFDGEAQVDGAGASLLIRAGRSAELRDDDVRTLQARSDAFDDWALARDRSIDGARSARYLTTEMTGYEELDRHGIWQDDLEYGPLWIPAVSSSWAPYRDGRWTWIAPWGWTWVDNAPWGYAPSHYGRWVQVRNRWAWAPGRVDRRPVWSPALVGWVGGSGLSLNFHQRGARPPAGWYPLGPRDRYVPHYRLSDERLRHLNNWSGRRDRDRDGIPDRIDRDRDGDGIPNRVDRDRDNDGIRNRFDRDRDRDGIRDRFDKDRDGDGIPNRVDRDGAGRHLLDRGQRSPVLRTNPAPGQLPFQPGTITPRGERGERGERFDGRRERPQPMVTMPRPTMQVAPPPAAPPPPPPQAIAPPPRVMAPPPAAAPSAPSAGRARVERRADALDNNRSNERAR